MLIAERLTSRQSLQLLEFLVKNGSERVVDDARSHLSLLRMLRQFHYIDQNGKDQGINVRNRSAELAKLLGDVEQIRQERKKARTNKNKYGGVEGGAGLGFSGGGSSRYGGFGSESGGGTDYGGYSGEVYGDGGGFGGRETDFSGTQRRGDQFEEYDEGDEVASPARGTTRTTTATVTKKAPPKPKEPEQDLFDFGENEPVISSSGKAPSTTNNTGLLSTNTAADDDDDFDDFQSADPPAAPATNPLSSLVMPPTTSTTTSTTQYAAPKPVQGANASGFNNLFTTKSPPPPSASPSILSPTSTYSAPSGQLQNIAQTQQAYKPSGPNYYASVPAAINSTTAGSQAAFSSNRPSAASNQPSYASSTNAAQLGKPASKPTAATGGDAFGSLWSVASTKAGVQPKSSNSKGPDLASMAKAKSEAGIWGASSGANTNTTASRTTPGPVSQSQAKPATPLGNGLDDLLG